MGDLTTAWLTPIVRRVLTDLRPNIAVLNAGSASLDLGRPILMPMAEILEFTRLAPGTVIATHMEALNHRPMTRARSREAVTQAGLAHKVRILKDGQVLVIWAVDHVRVSPVDEWEAEKERNEQQESI